MAALIALLQLDFARAGRTSPLTITVTSVSAYLQLAASFVVNGVRGGFDTVVTVTVSGEVLPARAKSS